MKFGNKRYVFAKYDNLIILPLFIFSNTIINLGEKTNIKDFNK